VVLGHIVVSGEMIDCLFVNLEVQIRVPRKDLSSNVSKFRHEAIRRHSSTF
jgi:hypothetical protein